MDEDHRELPTHTAARTREDLELGTLVGAAYDIVRLARLTAAGA